ncbi:hypothetical protein FE374_01435 [Georgenia yuyongxinii]|uniref:Uncharacterized protein n=1 Tax=Georgenia yuyongxinii TaxID=2589797 RepID=A0A5B8BYJ7_9MICO|nr:hypothetical protein [Georgenia yuyongxinii]QDC23469.1 hypothetical protein FE374_01435 [Georgenia yuyongxinii]
MTIDASDLLAGPRGGRLCLELALAASLHRDRRAVRSSVSQRSIVVCAESANTAAVSTYLAAGLTAHEPIADLQRGT